MGKIIKGYIMPHPPIIVSGVGQGREKSARATIEAVKRVAKEISRDKPTTIVLSSPHAPCFRDYVYLYDEEVLSGSFQGFGFPDSKLTFKNNTELAALILKKAKLAGIRAGNGGYNTREMLDHGALVPLYFIRKELEDFKLVCISTPFLSLEDTYSFGKCIGEAVSSMEENVVYVSSGDLSHRLTKHAPAGYSPKGQQYDEYIIDKIKKVDIKALVATSEDFLEAAGQCGTRSIVMMFGAFQEQEINSEIYSYEGPFGVGYLVAKISKTSEQVKLARETLETYIKENIRIKPPKDLSSEFFSKKAGVFVSIKKKGNLRGCIGTIAPTRENIAEEIISNAISSGTKDPRFQQVTEDELGELEYSVDVLGEPENITSLKELDVEKYGVIVTLGFRRGLLLPALQGVNTPEEQVSIALQKAGIQEYENYKMERFEVVRYK